jgi:hypothetical protein
MVLSEKKSSIRKFYGIYALEYRARDSHLSKYTLQLCPFTPKRWKKTPSLTEKDRFGGFVLTDFLIRVTCERCDLACVSHCRTRISTCISCMAVSFFVRGKLEWCWGMDTYMILSLCIVFRCECGKRFYLDITNSYSVVSEISIQMGKRKSVIQTHICGSKWGNLFQMTYANPHGEKWTCHIPFAVHTTYSIQMGKKWNL